MKKYMLNHKWMIAILLFITIIDSIVTSGIPVITKSFIEYIPKLNATLIVIFSLLYVGDVALILFFEYLCKVLGSKLCQVITEEVKNDLFRKIYEMPYNEFYLEDTDYYSNIFINDVDILYSCYFDCWFSFFLSVIRFLVYSIICLFLNYIIAIVIILTSILTLFVPLVIGKKLANKRKEQSDATEEYMGTLKDLLEGYSLNNKYTNPKFNSIHSLFNRKREKAVFKSSKYQAFSDIFSALSLYIINIATFVVGILLINFKKMDLSAFVALLSFVELMVIPSRDMIYEIVYIKSSKEIINKLEGILNNKKKDINYLPLDFKKEIKLSDVSFKYEEDDNEILNHVNLTIKSGKKYAIIGSNGSGKTTLKNIILGRIVKFEGNLTYDGIDAKKINIESACSSLDQSTFIFNASGMDNVTLFGSYQNNNIDKMIDELSMRKLLKSDLGEFGSKLSGGEKRKIDILRSYIRDSKVFIGDEIFENLDEKSEKEIKGFIAKNLKDKTWIEITHDLSVKNLSRFDEIILLKNGKVKEIKVSDEKLKEISDLI